MSRLSPYLFFVLAALAFAMVALSDDDDWQSEEVSLLESVLIVGGVFLGAHLLRKLVAMAMDRRKVRDE